MLKNISKKIMLFSMIFLLNNSAIGTIAYAAEQSNTLSSTKDSTASVGTSNKNLEGSKTKDSSKDTLNKNSSTIVADENQNKDDKLNKTTDNGLVDKENEEFIDYGWKTINNKKYYIVNNEISKTTGWFMEKDINKSIKPDDKKSDDKNYDAKYYLDQDFSAVIGWKEIEKNWYYFNSEGIMQTGWIEDSHLFYLDDSGIMKTGWNKVGDYMYFFNQYGQATVGKNLIGDNWYFFDNKGRLQKGFYKNDGKTYYSDDSGIMVTNEWINKSNSKYYIKSDGTIAIGNLFLDGLMNKFDKNGAYESSNSRDKNDLYVRYVNVGNADCQFIKLPSGETVLIDTGDTTTTKTVVDFLNTQNLKTEFFVPKTTSAGSTFVSTASPSSPSSLSSNTNITTHSAITIATMSDTNIKPTITHSGKGVIDYVILTHPHSDHIGGMIELMKNFNIGKVIVPKYFEMKDYTPGATAVSDTNINIIKYDYKVYKETMDALSKMGLPLVQAVPGAYIDSQNILQFLHSDTDYSQLEPDTYYKEYGTFNDNSSIVYLNYYDFQGLFSADIAWHAEKTFSDSKALRNRKVDVLKVPHHGNVGSSSYTFVGYVNPTLGIITRTKDRIKTNNEPYETLTTCGVNLYEISATDGLSVYATKDNWNMETK